LLRAFPAGNQNKPTETRQIHQANNDQSGKLVAIAPIHGAEYSVEGTSLSERGIAPSIKGGSTTLSVTAFSPCGQAVIAADVSILAEIVCAIIYSLEFRNTG
jgi:hypothetical protein